MCFLRWAKVYRTGKEERANPVGYLREGRGRGSRAGEEYGVASGIGCAWRTVYRWDTPPRVGLPLLEYGWNALCDLADRFDVQDSTVPAEPRSDRTQGIGSLSNGISFDQREL